MPGHAANILGVPDTKVLQDADVHIPECKDQVVLHGGGVLVDAGLDDVAEPLFVHLWEWEVCDEGAEVFDPFRK